MFDWLMYEKFKCFFRMAQMKQTSCKAQSGSTTTPSRLSQRGQTETSTTGFTGITLTPAVAPGCRDLDMDILDPMYYSCKSKTKKALYKEGKMSTLCMICGRTSGWGT